MIVGVGVGGCSKLVYVSIMVAVLLSLFVV